MELRGLGEESNRGERKHSPRDELARPRARRRRGRSAGLSGGSRVLLRRGTRTRGRSRSRGVVGRNARVDGGVGGGGARSAQTGGTRRRRRGAAGDTGGRSTGGQRADAPADEGGAGRLGLGRRGGLAVGRGDLELASVHQDCEKVRGGRCRVRRENREARFDDCALRTACSIAADLMNMLRPESGSVFRSKSQSQNIRSSVPALTSLVDRSYRSLEEEVHEKAQ